MPAAKPRKKPTWANRGIASRLNIRGQRLGVRVQRPGVDVVKETGFRIRSRTVGPKKKRTITI